MATKALKESTFVWEGADKKGARIKGEVKGNNVALIKASLRKQGINPLKVKKKAKPLFGGGKSGKKVTAKDIALFSRQMATMMTAGVPLVQSFEIVGRGHENPSMQDLIMAIKAEVEGGSGLAETLRKHPRYFDALYCNLVAAGEQAGILETLLHKIAIYKEKTEQIKSKVKKAMFYPVAIMVVAFIITCILLIFVIPQFAELFKGFGADLPAMTLFVMGMSDFMIEWWWAIFGGLGVAGFAFVEAKKRSKKFVHFLDRLSLQIPIIGNILTKAAIARFARTLATMFAAGVPLVEGLFTVSGAAGNVIFANGILKIREEVSTGQSLQASMRATELFPNMVVQMVAIGEESGSLDAMLGKVADYYEDEVDDAVDGLASLLEPIIMAVLGVLIGGLVIAMYLPIFKMGQVV